MATNIVRDIWGPTFIGFTLAMALYGVTAAQTGFYLRAFPDDSRILKALVVFVLLLDTAHIFWLANALWNVLVRSRLNPPLVLALPWEIPAGAIYAAVLNLLVQLFFAFRVWRLSGNKWAPTGIVVVFSFIQAISGTVYGIRQLLSGVDVTEVPIAVTIEMSSSATCDFFIAGFLVHYLLSKRTGVHRSESSLRLLIVYTLNVGSIGCVVVIITLVLLHTKPSTYLTTPTRFIISKCYANSLLATLNARRAFREMFRNNGEAFTLPTMPRFESVEHRNLDQG